jgi:hypothetical protein
LHGSCSGQHLTLLCADIDNASSRIYFYSGSIKGSWIVYRRCSIAAQPGGCGVFSTRLPKHGIKSLHCHPHGKREIFENQEIIDILKISDYIIEHVLKVYLILKMLKPPETIIGLQRMDSWIPIFQSNVVSSRGEYISAGTILGQ